MDRWEQLFADLEARFGALELQENQDLLQEHIRAESAQLRMWQRCAGAIGHDIEIATTGPTPVRGIVTAVAPQWVLLTALGRPILVPMTAIISFAAPRSVGAAGKAGTNLSPSEVTLNRALRTLSRDRQLLTVVAGTRQHAGVIGQVSADHITVVSGGHGEWEQRKQVTAVVIATAHISYLHGGR